MSNKVYQEIIDILIDPGAEIDEACGQACELATKQRKVVRFKFNGVELQANSWTNPRDLQDEFYAKLK